MINCPSCKRNSMIVKSSEDAWQRHFVCINCGHNHYPIRLSPNDMKRIQKAVASAERAEEQSAKSAARDLFLRTGAELDI